MVEKEKPSTSWHKIVGTRKCKAGIKPFTRPVSNTYQE